MAPKCAKCFSLFFASLSYSLNSFAERKVTRVVFSPAGVHIESVNSHGQTPLFCASFGGDNEVVALLLKLGANPNRRCGTNGSTPVHGAAYRGSRRVLRLLVEAGGDLSLEDNLEQTPR